VPSEIPPIHPVKQLATALDDALGLLSEFSPARELRGPTDQTPASLLDQCVALCEQQQASPREPIRTLHHLACTGGTLMSKCIAAMPNTQVLSEVDPLSTMQHNPNKPRFAPTDMVQLMRQSTRGVSSQIVIDLFLNNLETIYSETVHAGQRLILRDHAHSHFCIGGAIPDRPSFHELIQSRFPVLSVVTVRHPLDSFLSLKSNGWIQFNPPTFDEYCGRYIAFLNAHEGIPVIRYEDFVNTPQEVMSEICSRLEIPFSDQFIDLFSVFALTGDSGRRGNVIESKPRRPINADLAADLAGSANYRLLQERLKYDD
jgi:hypothetical protein